MAKAQSFAAKMAKSSRISPNECPECNTPISFLLHVESEKSDKTNAWRFNQKMVGVCKCNEKEIYG